MDTWKCGVCNSNNITTFNCTKCNAIDTNIELFFAGDVMHEFIKYLDGITLINFYFSDVLQSISTKTTAVNYWSLSKFISQNYFKDKPIDNNNICDTIDIIPSQSELYFSGNMISLKQKVCFHCDPELKFKDKINWNEEWSDILKLEKWQEWSKVYYGYKREQNVQFIQFKQHVPTPDDNKQYSNKNWMDCVNIDNLLKYLFDTDADELKTLDVYILDYTVMRTMDSPITFKTLENVTISFVKNSNFGDCFVAREWQQYEA
eukprot:472852_1